MDAQKALALLCRNAIDVISPEEFKSLLESSEKEKRPLRIKAGFDPSAPDIHLGHTVLLRKLREFQDLGHKVIFIIGDYTAQVGDPTGQSKTRPMLSVEQIEENAETYQNQAFKILDKDPKKIEIVRNSAWLAGPEMFQILFQKLGAMVTIDQLLVREDFDKRRQAHRPIAIRELMYPMLQGYDSIKVKADIELGGTDQKFNLLMGRDLQSQFGQKPQVVITLPLLVGLDGVSKMSKSLGNYIAVNDSAKDMFGKVMSIPDTLMKMYYDLLTAEKFDKNEHPRNAKLRLAKNIVTFYYGANEGSKQVEEFERVFSRKESPKDPDVLNIPQMLSGKLPSDIWIVDLLEMIGISSRSEARRLVEQGAVEINGLKITDIQAQIPLKKDTLIRAGKKKFVKIV